jgi:hypothetical protein
MKVKLLIVIGYIGLLSGCNALDGKCDYIPPNDCSCRYSSPYDPAYYNCNCRKYNYNQTREDLYHCGKCSCVGSACATCWACGKHYDFHDQ